MNILKAIDKLGQTVESALGASDHHVKTGTVKISESAIKALLLTANPERTAAINAMISGTATNEQKLIVARMLRDNNQVQYTVIK